MTYAQRMQRTATRYLRECLEQSGGNITQAARVAGVHRSTFYKLLARHGIASGKTAQAPRPLLNWPAPQL